MASSVDPVAVDESFDPSKLIVNYLPATITSATLKDIFSPYGTVEEANVVIDRLTKMSRGYGFVKFTTKESAQSAIDALNGKPLEGSSPDKPLHVAISKPPKVEVNLYVGNLLPTAKQDDLKAVFSRFGTVVECNIPIDRNTNMGKGYGFVRLDSKNAAHDAMEALGGVAVESISGSNPLSVKRAENNTQNHNGRNSGGRFNGMDRRRYHQQPRLMPPAFMPSPPVAFDGICLFVYNIPPTMDERGLQELFRPYGTVTGVRVMRNMNHSSKGFGFINMSTKEEANNAIASLNGRQVMQDRPLQVSFKRE